MRGPLLYAMTCLAVIAVVGGVAHFVTGGTATSALVASAGVALVVQMLAFAVARGLQARHLLLGWGLGSGLRLLALVLYALVVAKLWRASLTPALLSFVAFLFVTTVVEPVFLKR